MRQYETVLVIQPALEDEGVTSLVAQMEEIIQRDGGEILTRGQLLDKKGNVSEVTESWSKRRLAYAINGHHEGYFAVLQYNAPAESVGALEQAARLNEDVLRYMTVRPEA
jgi:small subunit ribosomal protein S6